ncbi:MAG TPA: glycosyltransferase family 4 protein [Gemmatimonadaceae bacterium]|nr:glycosyltransferase family 4 protein [Gemmatimonadaceae bacterium]
MRLLYLNHNIAWSGTFFRAYHLARQMVALGHEVTVVTTRRQGRFGFERTVDDGVDLWFAPDLTAGPARNGWDPWNTLWRVAALRRARFDLIHAFDSRPVVIGPALAIRARTGAPLFMDWADWWGRGGWIQERSGWPVRTLFGPIETWFEEAFRTRATGTTVISRALQARVQALGVPEQRIVRLPHGCDVQGLTPMDRTEARRALSVDAGRPIILHVGVLTPSDAALMFDMMRLLLPTLPKAQLVMVGKSRVTAPADLVSAGAVTVTGYVDMPTLHRWLGAADLCVIPMRDTIGNRGRWPSKINDYFAAARPTLMPMVGDAARVVHDAEAGWVCEPTPEAMAAAAASALGDEDALRRAGGRARALAEGPFAWPHLGDQLASFYHAMAA